MFSIYGVLIAGIIILACWGYRVCVMFWVGWLLVGIGAGCVVTDVIKALTI